MCQKTKQVLHFQVTLFANCISRWIMRWYWYWFDLALHDKFLELGTREVLVRYHGLIVASTDSNTSKLGQTCPKHVQLSSGPLGSSLSSWRLCIWSLSQIVTVHGPMQSTATSVHSKSTVNKLYIFPNLETSNKQYMFSNWRTSWTIIGHYATNIPKKHKTKLILTTEDLIVAV